MVLVLYIQVGMIRLLHKFSTCCTFNYPNDNKSKTKVVVFRKRQTKYNWSLDREHIDQIKFYLYLGLVFIETGSWPHFKRSSLRAIACANTIRQFTNHSYKGSLIPIIKVCYSKIVPMIIYGTELWGYITAPLLQQIVYYFEMHLGKDKSTLAPALRARV